MYFNFRLRHLTESPTVTKTCDGIIKALIKKMWHCIDAVD